VTWQPSHNAWRVHGKSANGQFFTARVKVQTRAKKGFLGAAMQEHIVSDTESFNSIRRAKYIEALHLWNTEDKTTRDRVVVPTE